MRVLGLIPARGGSKGIPRKNIRLLGSKPLLQYTIEAAAEASSLSRLILSTDDPEIADVGSGCGVEVPFLRPAVLAQDATPTLPVVQHALTWFDQRGVQFDAVCILQPTHPFRRGEDIDACVRLLEESQADSALTVLPVPAEHNPHWVFFGGPDRRLRWALGQQDPIPSRQALPQAFHRDGSIYLVRTQIVMSQNSLYGNSIVGHELDPAWHVNVDTPEDWERAEALLRVRRERGSHRYSMAHS